MTLANDDLKEVFDSFDADNDGEITVQELQKVQFNYHGNASSKRSVYFQIMNMHGFFPSDQEIEAMITKVDKNGNGTVDFGEFQEMMIRINDSLTDLDDQVMQAFQVFYNHWKYIQSAEILKSFS